MVYVRELFRELKHYKTSAMPYFFYHLARRITFVLVAIYMPHWPQL